LNALSPNSAPLGNGNYPVAFLVVPSTNGHQASPSLEFADAGLKESDSAPRKAGARIMTEHHESDAAPEQSEEARLEHDMQMALGYQSIGQFLFEFSQLQFTIRYVVTRYIGLEERYFNIVAASYDFAALCTVAQEVLRLRLPKEREKIDAVLAECRRLNDERVYGWSTGSGRSPMELSPGGSSGIRRRRITSASKELNWTDWREKRSG
jgi:hypothetical protein